MVMKSTFHNHPETINLERECFLAKQSKEKSYYELCDEIKEQKEKINTLEYLLKTRDKVIRVMSRELMEAKK